MLVAGGPCLAAVARMQARVVPGQHPGGGEAAGLGRADGGNGFGVAHGRSLPGRVQVVTGRCRAATGGAARHRVSASLTEVTALSASIARFGVTSGTRPRNYLDIRVVKSCRVLNPFPPAVCQNDREIGQYEGTGDQHPAEPAAGRHGTEEASGSHSHREQVATRPAVDVITHTRPGRGDLIDRLLRCGSWAAAQPRNQPGQQDR